MENKICLDTDFLVDFLRNGDEEVEFIKDNEIKTELATTYINLFELYYGAYKSERRDENLKLINQLIGRISLINLSDDSAEAAGKISAMLEKQGALVEFRDILIGAMALVNGYAVKTKNIKHFENIKELKVL